MADTAAGSTKPDLVARQVLRHQHMRELALHAGSGALSPPLQHGRVQRRPALPPEPTPGAPTPPPAPSAREWPLPAPEVALKALLLRHAAHASWLMHSGHEGHLFLGFASC